MKTLICPSPQLKACLIVLWNEAGETKNSFELLSLRQTVQVKVSTVFLLEANSLEFNYNY